VFAGVGERTREGNDLYREMIESGVIKLGDKQVIVMGFEISVVKFIYASYPVSYNDFCGRVKASVLLSTGK
jgi:hypothetical protein